MQRHTVNCVCDNSREVMQLPVSLLNHHIAYLGRHNHRRVLDTFLLECDATIVASKHGWAVSAKQPLYLHYLLPQSIQKYGSTESLCWLNRWILSLNLEVLFTPKTWWSITKEKKYCTTLTLWHSVGHSGICTCRNSWLHGVSASVFNIKYIYTFWHFHAENICFG